MSVSPTTVSGSAALEPSSVNNITLDTGQTGTIASTTSGTVAITTSSANEIIILGVAIGGSQVVSSVADTRSLTWYKMQACSNSTNVRGELWWALEPTAQSHTITVTLGASGNAVLVAGAFKNYNSNLPLDPAAIVTAYGNTTGPAATSYTVNPCDTLVGFVACLSNPTLTLGSGFTTVASTAQSTNVSGGMEYKTLTAASVTNPVGYTLSTSGQWVQMGFAIISTGAAGTASPSTSGTVVGNTFLIQANIATSNEFVLKQLYFGGPCAIVKWDGSNPILVQNVIQAGNYLFDTFQVTLPTNTNAPSWFVLVNTSTATSIDVGYEGKRSQ
jgi:hypothetical protein